MVKQAILVLILGFCLSGLSLAEDAPRADVVKIVNAEFKIVQREIHPSTGRPIYEAGERIPVGIVVHVKEADGAFRGGGTPLTHCAFGKCKPTALTFVDDAPRVVAAAAVTSATISAEYTTVSVSYTKCSSGGCSTSKSKNSGTTKPAIQSTWRRDD